MNIKSKKKQTGDNIYTNKGSWKFNRNVSKNFDSHVSKSVPLYTEGHELVSNISEFFINDDSIVYELGSSTGTLSEKIIKNNIKKNFKMISVDSEKSMTGIAKKKLKRYKHSSVICKDINYIKFKKSDLIVSYYTIQFIHPKFRQLLIDKIYESLNWGGAFILFEKVRSPDARFQDIMTQLYNEFKIRNGYSNDEILNKSLSLKGILEPFSTKGNHHLLKGAGFVDITSISKYICFEGFLSIK